MIIRVCSFTENGLKLAERIKKIFEDDIVVIRKNEDTDSFVAEAFSLKSPLIFIGACGIAVRKIAPYIESKLTDPPVIVIDEAGNFVIPILSGHMGGANDIAKQIASAISACAVITTATDVNDSFSIDVFAKKNDLGIVNKNGIKEVSSKVLKNENIKISIEKYPPDKNVDVIISGSRQYDDMALLALYPKTYYLGIGCRKDTPRDVIEQLAREVLEENDISMSEIAAISSIDLKKKEVGLNEFAQMNGVRFETFSKSELENVSGDFSSSEFVKSITGVDNVCERAAILSAGDSGELVVKKCSKNGVTIAIAKKMGL